MEGLVIQHGANRYLVETTSGGTRKIWACSIAGRLRQGPREGVRVAVIGDRVRIEPIPAGRCDQASIVEVLPRRNRISRPAPGGGSRRVKEQLVVANLDRLWIIVSLVQPPLNLHFVDRVLAAAVHQGVEAALVVNKIDLLADEGPGRGELDEVVELYRGLGYPVQLASAKDGHGLEELTARLSKGVSVFVGPSGAGKTSLLAALQPGLRLKTAEVSRRRGHGRHTTTGSRLYRLERGGHLADTPGMREFGLWGMVKSDLASCFIEFVDPASRCRFRDCLHNAEPDCAVRAAVEEGAIDPGRYRRYLDLLEELPERRGGDGGGHRRGGRPWGE